MTPAQDIKQTAEGLARSVSHSFDQLGLSSSPTAQFHNPLLAQAQTQGRAEKQLKPFDTQDVKILLLENVNTAGQDILRKQGYQVEALKTSLPEDQLIEKIR